MKTITLDDGRTVVLDIDTISPDQGMALAEAVAAMLVRSGRIRDDVALSGPHLLQFLSELGDELAQRREEGLVGALDEIHRYVDASDRELADEGITRNDVLERARDKREAVDPITEREMRRTEKVAVGDLDAGVPNHHDHSRRGFDPH